MVWWLVMPEQPEQTRLVEWPKQRLGYGKGVEEKHSSFRIEMPRDKHPGGMQIYNKIIGYCNLVRNKFR